MSLTYSTEKLSKECFADLTQQTITRDLVERTMFVHLTNIDATNANDYYARLKLLERLYGDGIAKSYVINDDEKTNNENQYKEIHAITIADIKKRIGIETNVRTKSPAEFLSLIIKQQKDLLKRNLLKEKISNNEIRAIYYLTLVECEKSE